VTISVDAISTKDENTYYGPTPFLPKTISHPGGTGLGGVLIYSSTRMAPSVDMLHDFTYAGVSVPEISGSPFNLLFGYHTTVGLIRLRTQVYMLSGIPDGTQDVVVTPTVDDSFYENTRPSLVIITLNSDNGGIALDATATLNTTTGDGYVDTDDVVSDPGVDITCSAQAFLSANLQSDWDSVGDFSHGPQSDCTNIFLDDYGIDMSCTLRRTNIEPAGAYHMGWVTQDFNYPTITAAPCSVIGTAIIEAGTPEPDGVWAWIE